MSSGGWSGGGTTPLWESADRVAHSTDWPHRRGQPPGESRSLHAPRRGRGFECGVETPLSKAPTRRALGWRPIPSPWRFVRACSSPLRAAAGRSLRDPWVLGMAETRARLLVRGPDFHGRRTSSGEVFDMYQLTAAHRGAGAGTWVVVTKPSRTAAPSEVASQRSGPLRPERIVDVCVRRRRPPGHAGPGSRARPPGGLASRRGRPPPRRRVRFTVQVGSFTSERMPGASSRPSRPAGRMSRSPGERSAMAIFTGSGLEIFPAGARPRSPRGRLRAGVQVIIMERDR